MWELGLTLEEQTCHQARQSLSGGDVDGAMYAALKHRASSHKGPAQVQSTSTSIGGADERDEAVASAVSWLNARHATRYMGVSLESSRASIFGRSEPLSRAEAWEFLRKAEELCPGVAWERLHTGYDRDPIFAQAKRGEHATLSFRDEDGRDREFRADPASPLRPLWTQADYYSGTFNWARSQAAWFLLTGEPPTLLPLTVMIDGGLAPPMTSTITVTVLAYGGNELAASAIATAQRRLLGHRRGPLALERHAMAGFVDQLRADAATWPGWAEACRRWNGFAPPHWRLRGRQLRYRDGTAMLDAYRRERRARRVSEARGAAAREKQARARKGAPHAAAAPAPKKAGRPPRRRGATAGS